jgi:hypothetical protein
LRRIDGKPDFSCQMFEPRPNPWPVLRRKRLPRSLGRRIRMNLKGKPTQVGLQFSRRLFGPDRAEIAERSNNVGPDVDYATHDLTMVARERRP